jgi:hypothetical protein
MAGQGQGAADPPVVGQPLVPAAPVTVPAPWDEAPAVSPAPAARPVPAVETAVFVANPVLSARTGSSSEGDAAGAGTTITLITQALAALPRASTSTETVGAAALPASGSAPSVFVTVSTEGAATPVLVTLGVAQELAPTTVSAPLAIAANVASPARSQAAVSVGESHDAEFSPGATPAHTSGTTVVVAASHDPATPVTHAVASTVVDSGRSLLGIAPAPVATAGTSNPGPAPAARDALPSGPALALAPSGAAAMAQPSGRTLGSRTLHNSGDGPGGRDSAPAAAETPAPSAGDDWDSAAAPSAEGADVNARFSPFDRAVMEQALDRFLDDLTGIEAELARLLDAKDLLPQTVLVGATLLLAELARRRIPRRTRDEENGRATDAGDEDAGLPGFPGLPGRRDWELL